MNVSRTLVLVSVVAIAACAAPPATESPDTRAADEAALRARIVAWNAASEAKDAAEFVTVYADDAVLMLEDAPDLRGIDTLREGVAGLMQDPNFALSFAADDVVVARSGDMAYETGTYSMTGSDADGQPVTESGHYVVVWRKEADGTWKVVVDAPLSDPPADGAGQGG